MPSIYHCQTGIAYHRVWKRSRGSATITPMRTLDRKSDKLNQAPSDPLMTEGKFNELQVKLDRLKKSQPQAAAEVRRLAEMGDFSENFAYQMAKGRLRGINNGILQLERQLTLAVIIKPKKTDRVEIGHTVMIENEAGQKTYQILGSSESKPAQGIISHNSPIGAALLGRRIGEKIKVKIGGKEIEYKIIEIK